MARPIKFEEPKQRTVRWEQAVDDLAVSLAHERKCDDGVGELLTLLVLKESKLKRGVGRVGKI